MYGSNSHAELVPYNSIRWQHMKAGTGDVFLHGDLWSMVVPVCNIDEMSV